MVRLAYCSKMHSLVLTSKPWNFLGHFGAWSWEFWNTRRHTWCILSVVRYESSAQWVLQTAYMTVLCYRTERVRVSCFVCFRWGIFSKRKKKRLALNHQPVEASICVLYHTMVQVVPQNYVISSPPKSDCWPVVRFQLKDNTIYLFITRLRYIP